MSLLSYLFETVESFIFLSCSNPLSRKMFVS